jgi:integrase
MSYIRKLKSGKWQVCIRIKNYPTITKTFNEKSLASQYGRDIESKMDRCVFEDYTAAASTTLGQILTRYRDEITPKKKGYKEETPKINLLLRHRISSYNLMQLKSSHLYKLKEEMLQTKAPKTVNDYLQLISHTWKTAKKVWNMTLPQQNPVELVQLEKVNNKRDITLTLDEYKKLLDAAENSKLNNLKDVIEFAYITGARFGEIQRLERTSINFEKKIITFSDTKNGADRTIPMANKIIEIIKKYPFGNKIFILKKEQFRFYFEQARSKAGLNHFRFHDLRACAITNMVLSGMNIAEVSSISGHKTWSQLRRYTRIKPEQLLDKINNVCTPLGKWN